MARILVVDDNATNRKLVVTLLQYEGHVPFEACDGMQGLAEARKERPDLIITDILMPSMDGYEFVRQLRADPDLSGTPVIFHTAHYGDPHAQALAAGCGVKHVLVKPCDTAVLLKTVALALSEVRGAPELEATGQFVLDHRRLISDKLVQKVEELQKEIDQRRRAEEKVQHLNRVYAVLSGINALIVRVESRDELCTEACRLAVEHGRFKVAWIGLYDSRTGDLEPIAWAGECQDLRAASHVRIGEPAESDGLVAAAIRSRRPVVCNGLASSQKVRFRDQLIARGYQSLVILPLLIGDRSVGCLVLIAEEPGFFDEREMQLLEELSGDISFALDHIGKAEQLDYLAYYDALTGLANPSLFAERVNHYIGEAGRPHVALAVVIVEIERLEAINDTLGRHAGDQLLRQAAERFSLSVGDAKHVARIGAGHLGAVIPEVVGDSDVLQIVEGWRSVWLDDSFNVDGRELGVSVRFGIALFPDNGLDAETLMQNAGAALKQARLAGNGHAFYARNITENRAEWLSMEAGLKRALENEEFVLHYQPKVDIETRRLKGVEALIRWQHPELGLVPPIKFIPLLEETGMIVEVGAWVMRQASLDRSHWLERRLAAPRVAVNVSTVQLGRKDFVRTVSDIVKLAGGEAGIDIEVTESLIMKDVTENIEKLTAVRRLGVGIAVDDFGTGYSSLGYLAKLPVETLKIDKSFVLSMLDDSSSMTLVSTMISLAHALKLTVVAEGVESEEQAKILRLLRCDQMQGFLISKPLSFDDMTAYLTRSR